MSTEIERRVAAIVAELGTCGTCQTCYGSGGLIVCVPDPDEADVPEYNPARCPECGMALRHLHQVLGISWDEI